MARQFDAIVVGSGLGGLTAAALYARTGRRVLVLERNNICGGAATVYRHGALAIEGSLHEIDGLDIDDPKLPILRSLGLNKDLAFVEVGDLYEVRGPQIGEPFALPCGMDRALKAASARFPHQAQALAEYFSRLAGVRAAVSLAARHQDEPGFWLRHAPEAVRRLWPLLREGRATVAEVLDELFGADEAVKLALAANLGYFHDDPARMSFVHFAIPQASYLVGGGHYIRGGSQALSRRLVELIEEAEGVVETGRDVFALIRRRMRHRSRPLRARPRRSARRLCAGGVRQRGPATARRDAAGKPPRGVPGSLCPSASVDLAVDAVARIEPAAIRVRRAQLLDLHAAAMGAHARRIARGRVHVLGEEAPTRLPPYVFVDYHRIDSGLNAAGPYLGSLCGIDRIENWAHLLGEAKQARKTVWMERLVADLDREFPGVAKSVVHREMATAETMAHYLNTPDGAVYGFAPEREGVNPLGMTARTAIKGLWLASAYVFGGGFTGAMMGVMR